MSWGEIGYALNSTVKDPSKFLPLDLLIQYNIDIANGTNVFENGTGGTYTVVVPVWASQAKITACGGGAGGGGSNQYYNYNAKNYGGGGGGAAVLNQIYDVPESLRGTEIQITVGSGGTGMGSYGAQNSTKDRLPEDGGATSISGLNITLDGGKASAAGSGTATFAGGAAGGAGGGAGGQWSTKSSVSPTSILDGEAGASGAGGTGVTVAAYKYMGGGGGSLGAGGNANASGKGVSGTRGGGGGAGYVNVSYSTAGHYAGGNGGGGYVKIEWLP